ncbi:DUF2375 family protein [Thalassotalea ponticola]|uniref:DUF2375 family protein n=1 Tax=Thalassotalea ponticola TaxID=1523392 RepID=UPI0025B42AE2|nr:DUF2375 family protein [Thalassotalea ponticola]MDN3652035.1 DUF2375 family protein [Thalassotalea ponticola]
MPDNKTMNVTVIYFDSDTLELKHHIGEFPVLAEGRVVLSDQFKNGKSIVAVCEGEHQPLDIELNNNNDSAWL